MNASSELPLCSGYARQRGILLTGALLPPSIDSPVALHARLYAGVVKLVDAEDSKSSDGDIMPVRVRPPALSADRQTKHPRFAGQLIVKCSLTLCSFSPFRIKSDVSFSAKWTVLK